MQVQDRRVYGRRNKRWLVWGFCFLVIIILGVIRMWFWPGQTTKKQAQPLTFPNYLPSELPVMDLQFSEKDWAKLGKKRAEALKSGILRSADDDRVKCKIYADNKKMDTRIRLKGDWVDHLRGRKWSYRVSLKGGDNWKGLRTFSLMTPEARDFLHEWMFHKILQREGLLTPRYGYLHLRINGESLGIYTWEEHFEKQLLEAAGRPEGPIVKYDEDPLWAMRQQEAQNGCRFMDKREVELASGIRAFKETKTVGDSLLRLQFMAARNLMEQYRQGSTPPATIFEVDQMGKMLAIADLTRTYHGLIWHNQRFYYNPITAKLEPIGFDGDTDGSARYMLQLPLLAIGDSGSTRLPRNNALVMQLLEDPKVFTAYRQHLERLCKPGWVHELMDEVETELQHFENLIAREFPGYRYDEAFLEDNRDVIRGKLAEGASP